MTDPLEAFSPAVQAWFRHTFGQPTAPQAAGWPAIQRGDHTLILAPTGSGKTLAAFLWGIDAIFRQESAGRDQGAERNTQHAIRSTPGIQLLYISPLKALNNDIERNLRAPLAGIRETAARLGEALPPLRVAVRTGDTPASARAAMIKQPPHILITTPESLYLLLTSPRARDMLRTVRTVIVDEIHTLVGEKRGAHLSLSLERLEHLAAGPIQRIGLSATVRPLEEAARFLGGQETGVRSQGTETSARVPPSPCLPASLPTCLPGFPSPRPVTIIDTGYRKPLDLQVIMPVDDFRELPGKSIWPSVIPQVVGDIMRHRSTLIFCNNRRLAERTADRLNAQISAERAEEVEPGSTAVLAPGGVMRDRGMFALGAAGPIRAHHGSMSKEARREMEEELKAGRLPALVGTSSLELGIDIGAVDLVVQLQSPKSVSQGLQRVGRSGHLVGQTSRGRVYATFREDLVEAAAVARGMLDGDVEPTLTPRNPLDVLAQQIAALVSVETWDAPALFDLVRRAYAYEGLSRPAFDSVLDMLSGKYGELGGPGHASLRARIAWDRVNDRLAALPGTRLLALGNPGTIADTGAFDVYLADGKTKVGTLDEEFIHESRPGDVFLLGSSTWRMREIGDDRIVVEEAAGALPRMPFWRGDYPWRQFQLGQRIGRLRREVAERLAAGYVPSQEQQSILSGTERRLRSAVEGRNLSTARPSTPVGQLLPTSAQGAPLIPAPNVERTLAAGDARDAAAAQDILAWLQRDYALDARAAAGLLGYVKSQVEVLGAISSDRTLVVESFLDAVGDPRLVIHSPFGGRVNGAWALALDGALRERYGMGVEIQADDDGILMRLPQTSGPPPVDLIQGMTYDEARTRILAELPGSALFGARFRMNAARALLLPKARGQKRTPFWLQRLRARDLLATVIKHPDFPLVTETYRDCLRDLLDLPHLQEVLDGIRDGRIEVLPVETLVPSPLAAGMLFNFVNVYMYEWDAPKAERALQAFAARGELLDDLLDGARAGALPKPEAVQEAVRRAGHTGPEHAARTADELAVILAELGDLTTAEVLARCAGDGTAWLAQLAGQGRIAALPIAAGHTFEERWVPAELVGEYRAAFDTVGAGFSAHALNILRRFLRHAGPVARAGILARYPFPPDWLDETIARLLAEREIVAAPPPDHYLDRHLFEQIQRRTLALLRREVQAVPVAAYAAFLLDWQGVRATADVSQDVAQDGILRHTAGANVAQDGILRHVLEQLRGVALPGVAWERDILPARLPRFQSDDLAALCKSGAWVWAASGQDPRRADVRFFPRGEGRLFLAPPDEQPESELAGRVLAFLKEEGASFLSDLQGGLGLKPAELRPAVIELALAGLITNDALDGLHALLSYRGEAGGERPPLSALEAELAARLGPRRPAGLTSTERYRAAKRRAAQLVRDLDDAGGEEIWRGRWAPLHRAGILGPPRTDADRVPALAHVLLARYGIVTREVAEREGPPWAWESLYPILQRMELRGEVRRGYFVAGLSGLQFAQPDAVERLRGVAGQLAETNALAVLNAVDPALVYSSTLPGLARPFARVPSTHVLLWRGQPVLVAEENGERLAVAGDLADRVRVAQRALSAYLSRPNAPRRIAVSQWNDAPILGSPGQPLLQQLGFTRTPGGMERWSDAAG